MLIPGLALVLLALHVNMLRPYFPRHILTVASIALGAVGIVFIVSGLYPAQLGDKYDPLKPALSVIEPEWYFMGFYQLLKTEGVLPAYGMTIVTGLAVVAFLVPFLDKGRKRHPLDRSVFTIAGVLVVYEFLAMTIYGYLTPGQTTSLADSRVLLLFLSVQAWAIALAAFLYLASRRFKQKHVVTTLSKPGPGLEKEKGS